MSRIGKLPVELPDKVKASITDTLVAVEGPKGKLSVPISKGLKVSQAENAITVTRESEEKDVRALHGLTRSLIQNVATGVSKGFEKTLEITGVGYRAAVKGKDLEVLVGYSHPISIKAPKEIEFKVEKNTTIKISGIDKQKVGQIAANIRSLRPPEPYKGKGIRYAGEHIRKKAGKTSGA